MKNQNRYRVQLKIKRFPWRHKIIKDIDMYLFKKELTKADKVMLPIVIKNYKKIKRYDKPYAQSLVEELFTLEEVTNMKPYFESFKGTKLWFTKVKLPVDAHNRMGVGANAVGGLEDFYLFTEHKEYPLDFKVWGYYNLCSYPPFNKSN